jgi:hypothetical protein
MAASLREISLGRDPEPRAKGLKQDRHQIRKQNDAEQPVTEGGATREIGRPVARVHVTDRDQITRAREREHLSPKARARSNCNCPMRFRQARRCTIDSPTIPGRTLIVHSDQVTVSFTVNKIDHNAGLRPNGQIDWPAADAAIFDQQLFRFGGVDLQRKNFAAMRAGDFCFDQELHVVAVLDLKHELNKQALETSASTIFRARRPIWLLPRLLALPSLS